MTNEGTQLKQALQRRADISECCKQPGTLVKIENTIPGSALFACKICGKRHRYMRAEPGMIGLRKT